MVGVTYTCLPPRHSCHRPTLPRLIATDLDGTLLHDDKTVSARTVAALTAAEEAGIEVVFVTGRPARWMGTVSAHVAGHGLAICGNGAAVVDLRRGGALLATHPLPRPAAGAVVTALRAVAPEVSFAVEDTTSFAHEPAYPPLACDPSCPMAPIAKLLGNDEAGDAPPVLKLLAHHATLDPDRFLHLAREHTAAYATATRSSPTALLEFSGRGVSKASTLADVCATRGIDRRDVLAFGDMPNDLEMLAWAGTSYAMANAHPAVLAATPRRTGSNEEDGVAVVIEEVLAGRHAHAAGPDRGLSESPASP